MIGRQLDRYRLIEEVGSGGMAVVYKGLDLSLDREIAVKVLHPHLAGKEESRRRFSREARAVARLRHPSIVEIFDFSSDEAKESYIVTEFVSGRTLRAFGDEVGFPLPEIGVLVAERLAEALVHAHGAGVVHRDLKPENVMVSDEGTLKLMDFGIARMVGQDERMTMTGAMVGSPLHMAPEVIEGRDAGELADIFSLGTILYWLVTGEMAFQGNNTTQTLRRILEGDFQDPRTLAPACSDALAALIARCLERDPAARPQQASELQRELQGILIDAAIEPGEEELRRFFLDPAAYTAALHRHLVEHLLAEGCASLEAKQAARALRSLNRVLALEPADPRVLELLARMRRSQRSRARLRRVGLLAAALAAGGAGAWALLPLGDAPGTKEPDPLGAGIPPAPHQERAASSDEALARDGEPGVSAPLAQKTDEGEAGEGPPRSPAKGAPGDRQAPATPPGSPALAAAPSADTPSASPTSKATPASRTLHLRWVPQGASLSIDGVRKDTVAPTWTGELPVGRHRIALSHDGCCEPLEEVIVLEPGDAPLQRSLVLAPKESGWFEIDCDQPLAEVWLDGTFKGTVEDVNSRGGVAVGFSKDDSGRDRYVKTVRFELFSPRADGKRERIAGEVTVRSGQRSRTAPIAFALGPRGAAPLRDGQRALGRARAIP